MVSVAVAQIKRRGLLSAPSISFHFQLDTAAAAVVLLSIRFQFARANVFIDDGGNLRAL